MLLKSPIHITLQFLNDSQNLLVLAVKFPYSRFKSGELRGNIDSLLSTSCTELMTAWSACNRNFKVRAKTIFNNLLHGADDRLVSLQQEL